MADDTPKTTPPTQQNAPPAAPPQSVAEKAEEPPLTPEKEEVPPPKPSSPVFAAPEPESTAQKPLSEEVLKSDSSTPAEKQEPPPALEAAALAVESQSTGEKEEKASPPPQESVATEQAGAESAEKREELEQPAVAAGMAPEPDVRVTFSAKQESVGEESEKEKVSEERKIPESLVSFKEESNLVADLSDTERTALQELKQMVQDALKNHLFTSKDKPSSDEAKAEAPPVESDASTEKNPSQDPKTEDKTVQESKEADELSIWGIPLLKDDRSDVILLKFLRARDFKVKDAFAMLKNTIQWRREFGIDALIDEDLGDDLEKVVFMHGHDRDGHPVCYNVYGEFQNKDLYQKTLGGADRRAKFLRWRIQFLEKSIRKLDFSPGGINTIFQVNDLRNSPGPGKKELRLATKQALNILQDNYPEFVAKQVFINVPWWYLAFYTMINPFLTQRTKSKFVFAGPSKTADTLFKYISPEQVPVQYGGLSVDYCDCNPEFTIADPVTDMIVKPGTKQTVEIIIYEKCVIVWELRVVGWEVSYGAEFVPNAKDGYTVIIQKPTKMAPTDEPVVSNSFRVSELGKVLLTIDNPTSKKKKLLYRFKIDPLNE